MSAPFPYDLSRTKDALDRYDELDAAFRRLSSLSDVSNQTLMRKLDSLERQARAVGRAYGLDTAIINSPDTCETCVHPGPKYPRPGAKPSFVRRMVQLWESPRD